MMARIAVIGAGVIGLSVGTHLLQTLPRDALVTVLADRLPPDTLASDKSGGLILFSQHFADHGRPERILRWVTRTRAHLDKIYNSAERDRSGISSMHGFMANEDGPFIKMTVDGKEMLPGWREASATEKQFVHCSDCEVLTTDTYGIQSSTYMQWLLRKFTDLGGVVVKQKLDSLSSLDSYDIIINCSGVGARELVGDENVYPVRGHTLLVHAPWVKNFFFEVSTRTLILPHEHSVVLGSMMETHNGDTSVDPNVIQLIREKAERRMPSLKRAEDVEARVGVRPMRMGGVRLERDLTTPSVIHCYGHGTNGYCYHWGCAEEVEQLVWDIIRENLKSKL